jgi:hypothetical protein
LLNPTLHHSITPMTRYPGLGGILYDKSRIR